MAQISPLPKIFKENFFKTGSWSATLERTQLKLLQENALSCLDTWTWVPFLNQKRLILLYNIILDRPCSTDCCHALSFSLSLSLSFPLSLFHTHSFTQSFKQTQICFGTYTVTDIRGVNGPGGTTCGRSGLPGNFWDFWTLVLRWLRSGTSKKRFRKTKTKPNPDLTIKREKKIQVRPNEQESRSIPAQKWDPDSNFC